MIHRAQAKANRQEHSRELTIGRPLGILLVILIVPFIVLLGLLAYPFVIIFSRPKRRSGEQVACLLESASEGTLSARKWRRFTHKAIRDERLDAIRQRAIVCGPPGADRLMLRQLVKEARTVQL